MKLFIPHYTVDAVDVVDAVDEVDAVDDMDENTNRSITEGIHTHASSQVSKQTPGGGGRWHVDHE